MYTRGRPGARSPLSCRHDQLLIPHHLQARVTAFSDANWGNNPDDGKSISSYIMLMSNGPVNFKFGLRGITAQSTTQAELVAAALTMREAVYCANTMEELEFGKAFKCVPFYIGNASALHVAGNSTFSSRAKHVAVRVFYIHEIVQERKVSIHYVA